MLIDLFMITRWIDDDNLSSSLQLSATSGFDLGEAYSQTTICKREDNKQRQKTISKTIVHSAVRSFHCTRNPHSPGDRLCAG
jgi:hypothetical protein